ncbi:hypothetical protein A2962_03530 [Candidatus Woesebacteria bacterium RIFCSPLOWO2_01_FULL_39_61]|nr:MAG: hypothetical protein A2692_00660 [Candidatus Woesebacteria bacterium RIFCSPHIGHO2_01_FULL_39_95]OGM38721.1 MAG: hypothetical protein A3E13_03850 [Candidatus Woesebacteria bacterium RIFCSPHIGHO2_12_FULL_40_20]OGM67582.1 MAG: hypothetical protein A2962_03530 [Candidatus Woesebacteria bacterium RIFCSPLOWO2_01_FULL_39_61]
MLLISVTVWLAVLFYPEAKLKIIACDVGQGDAFLITYKVTQILIDSGPGRKVLECLDRNIPFWDREIEMVMLSHPQKDHYGGFLDVIARYDVQVFVTSGLDSSSQEFQLLKSQVTGGGIKVVDAVEGMTMRVGLIYLDILHPSKEFLAQESTLVDDKDDKVLGVYTSKKDPNEFSIVAKLRYKNFDALFTGDASPELSNIIAQRLSVNGKQTLEYIKIPHHGSRNGLTEELLKVARPRVAVISVGRNNNYGHPHEEILKILEDKDIKVLRTDLLGDIQIVTDGESWWEE